MDQQTFLCIICRKDKSVDQSSDEHAIPDAIGGYWHIRNVCVTCNSNMGSKVDSPLINHQFIKFYRYLHKLPGKDGAIPNPFSGTHEIQGMPEQKVRVELGKDSLPTPFFVTKVDHEKIQDEAGERLVIDINIDASEEKKINSIIDKICKRNGFSNYTISSQEKEEKEDSPQIHAQLKIDIGYFKIGIVKIAYEFACHYIPGYLLDPTSLVIAKVLENGDHKELESNQIFLGTGFERDAVAPFVNILGFKEDCHYLILSNYRGKTICFVCLFGGIFCAAIVVSNLAYDFDSDPLIGINSISKKSFLTARLSEYLSSELILEKVSFQYEFNSMQEVVAFSTDKGSSSYEIFSEDDSIPLFDASGKKVYNSISEMDMKKNEVSENHFENGELISEMLIKEDLYIKVLPSGNHYKIKGLKTSSRRKSENHPPK